MTPARPLPAAAAPGTAHAPVGALAMRWKLVAAPFSGRLFRARTPLLVLHDEHDFASCQQLGAAPSERIYHVSYGEKYELLVQLLALAREHLDPVDRVLLTSRMPSGVRFPPPLLAPDVFLCHDPAAEVAHLRRLGRHVLVVRDRLVRHQLECGDNTLGFEWIGPEIDRARFDAFAQALATRPWLQRLAPAGNGKEN